MYDKQDGKCAICTVSLTVIYGDRSNTSVTIDHNHLTGKIRELLCRKCNRAIGSLDEDISRMQVAIEYLQRHNDD